MKQQKTSKKNILNFCLYIKKTFISLLHQNKGTKPSEKILKKKFGILKNKLVSLQRLTAPG